MPCALGWAPHHGIRPALLHILLLLLEGQLLLPLALPLRLLLLLGVLQPSWHRISTCTGCHWACPGCCCSRASDHRAAHLHLLLLLVLLPYCAACLPVHQGLVLGAGLQDAQTG
jgi:hypothetical protein